MATNKRVTLTSVANSICNLKPAQQSMINLIEMKSDYRFSDYEHTPRGAHQFISDHYDEVKDMWKSSYADLDEADAKLFKRGIPKEDIAILRLLENLTGEDFSKRRQIRSEVYSFIEEYNYLLA